MMVQMNKFHIFTLILDCAFRCVPGMSILKKIMKHVGKYNSVNSKNALYIYFFQKPTLYDINLKEIL